MKKSALSLLLVIVMAVMLAIPVGASQVIDDANSAKDSANAGLTETNRKINQIEAEQADLQNKIDALDADLVALLIDIDVLTDEIADKKEDIKTASQQLEEARELEAKQYEDMKLRIRYMYEHSKVNYFQSILESKSISELLNRVSYFNDVYKYDRNQLLEYQDTVVKVAQYKEQLEQEESDLEDLKDNYTQESEMLEAMLDEKRATMEDYDVQLASARDLAAQYKATIDEQNRIIAAEEERLAEEERKRQEEERRRAEEEERQRQAEEAERQRLAEEAERQRQEAERRAAEEAASQEDPDVVIDPDIYNEDPAPSYDEGLNPAKTTSVSGSDVCDYALQFVGNPYVWGGTSLTDGCDCSGFTQQIFKHFGISIPRTSYEQRSCGNTVSYSNAQPGDIICYSGHVAIYIGGGRIVGAQSSRSGITTANATYRTILSVRRVI